MEKANRPMATTPISCTRKSPPAAMQVARVPHTPAKRCAGTAPTTSSIRLTSSTFSPIMPQDGATAPIRIAHSEFVMFGPP